MKFKHYLVINKFGEICADGQGRPDRVNALKKAIAGKINSYVHAATVKILLEQSLGNEPEIIEYEFDNKNDAKLSEERSHILNGTPSANSTERYEQRLKQLGWTHDELDGYAECFMDNVLKHGDNISTSRADFKKLMKKPTAWLQIKTILGIK